MSIPPHTLNLYQKPAIGNSFINRFHTYNYKHSINAIGGFDAASCEIALRSVSEMLDFLDQYLGNRVAIFVDNPAEPCWEGFINRMTFSAGGMEYTISLDQMANRVTVTYTPSAGSTDATLSAVANNTDSQAVYGIKQENIDFGQMRLGSGATALRDTVIAQRAWPKSSITRGQGDGLMHLELLGFYHTLKWDIYSNSGTASSNLGVMVNAVRTALANGTTFFDNADTAEIVANTTAINQEHVKRETSWDTLKRFQEIGNGGSYYVIGVTPTLFSTGTRRMYYRAANTAIKYTARQSDGLRIRNPYGQLIPPWTVRPDAGVRISDMLIGWNGIGDNPAETYINGIDYDANAQTVDWHGDDDTRAEGAFQLARYGRPIGKKFSATVRRSV